MYKVKANKEDKKLKNYELFENIQFDVFSFANAISEGIYILDKNGVVIAVNKVFTDITGVEEFEVVGMDMQTVWEQKMQHEDVAFIEAEHKLAMPNLALISKKDKGGLKVTEAQPIGLLVIKEKKVVSVITSMARKNNTVIITGIPIFDDLGEVVYVVTAIRDITEITTLMKELDEIENDKNKYLNELKYLRGDYKRNDLIGKSNAVEEVRHLIEKVAKTDVTILITGETGTGKEVVSKEICKESLRKDGPYIKVNCAAIPENLLESELFGYEKGAFTGAQQKAKLGLFEMANHGTILLDEIGEMPVKLQAKLLRVLQEKEFTRVGGIKNIHVDVRVIASTNQNLQKQIKNGSFREDLYYRLNIFPIKLLPLRERREDISILSFYFIERFNKKYNKHREFEETAIATLKYYDWPGNVRELQNIIERLVVISDEVLITRKDIVNILGPDLVFGEVDYNSDITLKDAVDLFEKDIIEKALKKYGSTYKAAKVLGVTQSTVVRKAKILGIEKWY